MVVLDASAVIAWAYREEDGRLDGLIRHVAEDSASVPAHWLLEVTNSLVISERKGRISTDQRQEILASIQVLPIRIDEETCLRGWEDIPALARRHQLTTYDAAYLELALRTAAPLATLDHELASAARAAGARLYA